MKKDLRTDQVLVMSFANGDDKAFNILFRRHNNYVTNHIEKLVKDHAKAEDIAQDAFIKVISAIKNNQYEESSLFRAWVLRIAHNLSIDFLRKNKRSPVMIEVQDYLDFHEDNMPVDGQLVSIISKESSGENNILQILEKIPEEQRVVLILRYFEDFSFQEIAKFTGASINTALGRARYGLINMRRILKEEKEDKKSFRK